MESIQLRERPSPGARCAYCHDGLGDTPEPFRCARCHVELHRDCRRQLGRCPTLGCLASGLTPISLAALHRAFTHEAGVPRWWALAGLYVPLVLTTVLLAALTLVLLALPMFAVIRGDPRDGMGQHTAVVTLVLPLLGAAFGAAWATFRSAHDLARTPNLLVERGEERTLVVWETALGRRVMGLESGPSAPGPGWLPIEFPDSRPREGRWPVLVRGLGSDGSLIVETESGKLALARRVTHAEIRPPGLWRRQRRREGRP